MVIDATTLFDLLKLSVNRNDEKIRSLAESLFAIYTSIIDSIPQSDVRYCELYVKITREVMGNQLNVSDHKMELLNIFKRHLSDPVFKKDSYVKESLADIVRSELSPARIADVTKRLNLIVQWYTSSKYIGKMYGHLREGEHKYSMDEKDLSIANLRSVMDEFRNSLMETDIVSNKNGPIEVVNSRDKESIRKAFGVYKERRITNIMKTGLQGLNQMFGGSNGMALGESLLFLARTHHFKSGMLMKMAQWIVTHNTPPSALGKRPVILMISLENDANQNMMKMWNEFYVALNGALPPKTMSDDEIVEGIYDYFNRSDYDLIIERYIPEYFGYDELVNVVTKYENSGFKVIATILDYITQMKTHNLGTASKSGNHDLLIELCNKVINFHKSIGTTLITAAQLNSIASKIAASGIHHRVKSYNEQCIASATGIAREFDFMAYLEIEKDEQDESWLTISWGKHRYVDDTPEAAKFCAYKFHPIIGISSDVNGNSEFVRNIYSTSNKKKASTADLDAILGIN